MNLSLASILHRALNLIYPPACLHCKGALETQALLCPYCIQHLTLVPPEGRCIKCFQEINVLRGTCQECRKIASPFRQFGSCFERIGPIQTLLNHFTSGGDEFLAKEFAAYIVVQIDRLEYPPFNGIVPIGELFSQKTRQVAREVCRLSGIPLITPLQRHFTPEPSFSLKKRCKIVGNRLLLLGLVAQTGQPLHFAAEALHMGDPATIYGITLC